MTIPGLCANGDCINKEGSFKCRCPEGFIMTDDGRSCIGKIVQIGLDVCMTLFASCKQRHANIKAYLLTIS